MSNFRSTPPPSGIISELNYVPPVTTEIGQTTLYITEPRPNEVIKLHLYWPYGSRFQEQKSQARTALSLSLNGSSQYTAEQIQEQFDFWGSSIGFDTALMASEIGLKCTREFYLESLNWLIQNHMDANFPQHELENYKQIETAALQRKVATPRYWAYRLGMEGLFGPENVNTSFTDPIDIAALNTEQLASYHGQFLHPSLATWIISGDTDEQIIADTKAIISKLTAKTPLTSRRETAAASAAHDPQLQRYNVENTTQVSMFLTKKIPAIGEKEYHLFSLLNLILGGFFGSRLMQEIREEKGLTYGIGSYIQQTTEGNVWCISGEMNSSNADLALAATREILQGFISTPPAGEELERAKRYFSGQLRTSFDGPFSMGSKIKGLLTRGYTFEHYNSALSSIWGASTDDLCQLANNYLRPETFDSVLAGDIS